MNQFRTTDQIKLITYFSLILAVRKSVIEKSIQLFNKAMGICLYEDLPSVNDKQALNNWVDKMKCCLFTQAMCYFPDSNFS